MSPLFKVGDLVVRNPEAQGVAGWPYGDEVCRVVGYYPILNEIAVVPADSPPNTRHHDISWLADRFTPAPRSAPLALRLSEGLGPNALEEQPAESLDGKLVMGLAVIRELTGTQKTDNIEATIEAVRKAVAPQPAKREPLTWDELDVLWEKQRSKPFKSHGDDLMEFARVIERAHGIGEHE